MMKQKVNKHKLKLKIARHMTPHPKKSDAKEFQSAAWARRREEVARKVRGKK